MCGPLRPNQEWAEGRHRLPGPAQPHMGLRSPDPAGRGAGWPSAHQPGTWPQALSTRQDSVHSQLVTPQRVFQSVVPEPAAASPRILPESSVLRPLSGLLTQRQMLGSGRTQDPTGTNRLCHQTLQPPHILLSTWSSQGRAAVLYPYCSENRGKNAVPAQYRCDFPPKYLQLWLQNLGVQTADGACR